MTKQRIIEILGTRQAGAKYTVSVVRPAKLRAAYKTAPLVKASLFSSQLASYAHRAPVKAGIASGERAMPSLPVWVDRVERMPNGLTFWIGKNGETYLAAPRFGDKAKSAWFLDGKEVSLAEVRDMLLASEYAERPSKVEVESKAQAMFNAIKLNNITQIS